MKKFPIGIQLFSLRWFAEEDLKGTLVALKEMGYDGVEFAGLYGYTPEEVKAMVDEIGLVPISAHVPIENLLDDTVGEIAKYKAIGCKYIALPWISEERRPGGQRYAETEADIEMIAKEAKKQGITLLYHNHDFEFVKVDGDKYALDVMYETIPADLLQTELDTCWVNVAGENPAEYIRKYSGRAPIVHLKDFVGQKSANMYELIGDDNTKAAEAPAAFHFAYVGSGKQDFPSIIEASEDAGAQWLIVEQDLPNEGMTALECAKASREYLKSIGQ